MGGSSTKLPSFFLFFSLISWSLVTLFWNNRQKTMMSNFAACCCHVVFTSVKEDDKPAHHPLHVLEHAPKDDNKQLCCLLLSS